MCEGPVVISAHINGEVTKTPLKGETSAANDAFRSLSKRRNSWGDLELDLDLDDCHDNEGKPRDGSDKPDQRQGCEKHTDSAPLVRRSSWDELDLSDHLKRHGDGVSADNCSENQAKNIVLVGRVDDTEEFLTSPGPTGTEKTKKKKDVKSLSDRLGLMSPFKGKNKMQTRNTQEPAVPKM